MATASGGGATTPLATPRYKVVASLGCAALAALFACTMKPNRPPVGLSSMRNNYTFNGRPLTALDASRRLFWVEDFLSEQEVDILRAVGAANPAAFEAADRLDYATATLPRDNEVTREIEERIAAITGCAKETAGSNGTPTMTRAPRLSRSWPLGMRKRWRPCSARGYSSELQGCAAPWAPAACR